MRFPFYIRLLKKGEASLNGWVYWEEGKMLKHLSLLLTQIHPPCVSLSFITIYLRKSSQTDKHFKEPYSPLSHSVFWKSGTDDSNRSIWPRLLVSESQLPFPGAKSCSRGKGEAFCTWGFLSALTDVPLEETVNWWEWTRPDRGLHGQGDKM